MTTKLIQTKKTTLSYGINDSGTSMRLVNLLKLDGTAMSASDIGDLLYGTFDPGTSREEIFSINGANVTVNADGSVDITGVVRGLKEVDPYGTGGFSTDHPAGAIVIFGNNPQLFQTFASIPNDNEFEGENNFILLPTSSGGNATDGDQLITYAQALAMFTGGTGTINRIVVAGNAGETVTAGQLLYLLVSDGEWYKCDADTAATVDNIILGIAQGAGTNGNPVTSGILLFGLDSNQTGLTNNTAYYASNTAGAISSTPGTTEVSVGIARSTTSLLFYPRYNQQITENEQDLLQAMIAGNDFYGASSTGNDTYVISVLPIVSYANGMRFRFKADVGNTGPASLNVNGLGAITIKKNHDVDLSTGDIEAGQIVEVIYNSTGPTFEMMNQLAAGFDSKGSFTAGAAITAGQALHLSPYAQTDGGITLDVQTATAYGSTTNQSMSFTVASNSNRVLLVGVTAASAPSGVTYNSVAMTLVDSQAYGSGSQVLYVYRLVAPATGTNNITVTGTSIGGISGASYYNVDQTTPIDVSSKGNASAGTITLAITTVTPGAFVHTFYGQGGLSSITSGSNLVSGKYVKSAATTVVSVANGSNPYLFSSTVGKVNEAQALTLVGATAGGSGTPVEAMMNIALKPATAVSMGVVPTTSSAITLNEPLIDFIGFADSTVTIGATVTVSLVGIVTGLSGLTSGKKYYLSDTPGAISASQGTYAKVIGTALSSTTLLIAPDKTFSTAIAKTTAYQYTAECDGILTAMGTSAGTLSIVAGTTITGTGTATNGSNMTFSVKRGSTYTITANVACYFTPVA